MKRAKKILGLVVLLSIPVFSFSQTKKEKQQFKEYTTKAYATRLVSGDSTKLILDEQRKFAAELSSNEFIAKNLVNYYHCYWVFQSNPYDSATVYLKKGIEYGKKAKAYPLLSDLYGQLAQEELFMVEYKKAHEAIDNAIFYGEKENSIIQLNNALYFLASLQRQEGNDREALKSALEGVKLWDKIKDHSKTNLDPKAVLAGIYEAQGKYKLAEENYRKIIARNEKNGFLMNVLGFRNSLASVLTNAKKIELAKIEIWKCIKLADSLKSLEGKVSAHADLAYIYLDSNDLQLDSVYYYLSGIEELIGMTQNPAAFFRYNAAYGDYHLKTNNARKAKSFYLESYNLYLELGGFPAHDMMTILRKLAIVSNRLNQPKEALAFYQKHMEFREKFLNREKIEELKEIEMSYDFEKKELAALAKKRKTELNYQRSLAKEQQGKYLLILGLCLVIVIAAFVWFALQKRKKQAAILDKKNTQIQRNLEEKQLLLKEIHHRVKNNFQIVSSLLEMQTRGIEDEQALELAKEGQNRVKSMAIIHQKLYQNDDLLVDFEEYVVQLVSEIQGMYASKKMNSKIEVKEGVILDIDTAIPLGLVLNELITNAFKYGFVDGKEGNNLLIKMEKGLDNYTMIVADNGNGISENVDLNKTKSIGLYLVRRLSKQLGGSMRYSYKNGSEFEIQFKDTTMRMG